MRLSSLGGNPNSSRHIQLLDRDILGPHHVTSCSVRVRSRRYFSRVFHHLQRRTRIESFGSPGQLPSQSMTNEEASRTAITRSAAATSV